jgi:PAS domain S-box-containing protein
MARIASPAPIGAEEAERLAAIVEHSDDAIITKDHRAVITSWNPAAERLYGYSEREAVGRPIEILVPPHRKGEERRILARILAGDRVDHYETERLTKYGRMISVSITVSPLKGPDGRIVGASVIARDTTTRRRLQRAQRFLAQAGAALDRSLDPDETLRSIGRLIVPDLGELCVVDLLEEDGGIAGAAAAVAKDPELAQALERLRREYPLDPAGPHPVARVLRTGRSEVLAELTDEVLEEIAQSEEHLDFMRRLRYRSALVAPLQARGRTLGALSVLHLGETQAYGPEDLVLVEELGRRAAIALDNSRLYEELARARESDAFLSETSRVLGGTLDYQETLSRVADLAVPQVADWCVVDVATAHEALERVALAHRDPERVKMAMEIERRYAGEADDTRGPAQVIRTGRSEFYREIPDELLQEGARNEHLEALRELGMTSAMIVPMVARKRTLGTITLVSSTPGHHFDEFDLAQAEELGRRAGIAVENAWLYSERSRVAQTLQASLLPRALPHIPGVELASRFRPAGDGLEVGGDFYDVFPASEGTWLAAIGDVCGKGADAASLTALARHTLRALAERDASPRGVLAQLNHVILGHEEVHDRFLTLLLVSLRPAPDGRVTARLAAAGHPPPIKVDGDGGAEPVAVPGMLLGLFEDVELVEHEVELKPGDCLLMYTDGLTDAGAPDRILGPEDVAACLAGAAGRAAPELIAAAESLARDDGARPPRDDIAILALRVADAD